MMPFQTFFFRRFSAALALYFCAVALAQQSVPLDVDAERLRIRAERSQQEATFAQAERNCYRHFAVSDCLYDARRARRSALDELRRQEVVLNDLQRKTQAAQALQRIQDNISNANPLAPEAQ